MSNISALAQSDTFRKASLIKLEIGSALFFDRAFSIQYERAHKPNESFAVNAGYQSWTMDTLFVNAEISERNVNSGGFKVGADYRFYLMHENKYAAPRGVYIGGFFSYLQFFNEKQLENDQTGSIKTVNLSSNLAILNFGGQLGYQFIIKDKWSIDLVFMGPSIANYRSKVELNGDFQLDLDESQQAVLDQFFNRFPRLATLSREGELNNSGKSNWWGGGFRYYIMVGYKFPTKKRG